MSDNKKSGKYTKENMITPPDPCNHDRVKNGWKKVISPTIDRFGIDVSELTIIDVGSSNGRKSLQKYVADKNNKNIWEAPGEYGLVPSNMSAIEGDPAVLDDLRKNVPGLTVFHHDFSSAGLTSLNIQKRYHVALLCEVLEHLYPGEDQMRLLRDTAELVAPGGGMHVTFPRQTHIDCVKGKPWGHKCEEVSRHEVMNILAELFDEVIWAQSASKGSFSGTVNFFALGRK